MKTSLEVPWREASDSFFVVAKKLPFWGERSRDESKVGFPETGIEGGRESSEG